MAKAVVSKKFNVIRNDVEKILVGAVVAGLGAFFTVLLDQLPNVDWDSFTPLVVAILSILTNIVRKWFNETKYK